MEKCKYFTRVLFEKDVVSSGEASAKEIFGDNTLSTLYLNKELKAADDYVKQLSGEKIQKYLNSVKRRLRSFPICSATGKYVDLVVDVEKNSRGSFLNSYFVCTDCYKCGVNKQCDPDHKQLFGTITVTRSIIGVNPALISSGATNWTGNQETATFTLCDNNIEFAFLDGYFT